MGFFDKKHENDSPIGNLRAHIGTYMYFVKVGKSKFKNKGRIGEIFADMDNTQFLFQQATSGTMYDFKKKLDYALWDAALHKYTEDMDELKKELLKAVDAEKMHAQEEKEKEEQKEKEEALQEESGDWRENLKDQMKKAEEKEKELEEKRKQENEEKAQQLSHETEEMTEADCRELWRIMQGLEREFREMKNIADDWFTVNGKKNGCMGALVAITLLPVGLVYGLWQIF